MTEGILYHIYAQATKILLHLLRILPTKSKIKSWYELRKSPIIKGKTINANHKNLLFICSSLGEYESIRGLIPRLEESFNIHLCFFSSSGYDILMPNKQVYHSLSYTPIDSYYAVNSFLDALRPDKIIIAQNFLWPTLLREIIIRDIPLYLLEFNIQINTLMKQLWYKLWSSVLAKAKLISCSDLSSYSFIEKMNGKSNLLFTQHLRLLAIAKYSNTPWNDVLIEDFVNLEKSIILGSTHHRDIKLFRDIWPLIQDEYRLLIVPHETDETTLNDIQAYFPNAILYSDATTDKLSKKRAMIVDKKGVLKYLFRYGDLAYIGGGFDSGIHNALEAAVYKLPVIFGPKYEKFSYARQMIVSGEAVSIDSSASLHKAIQSFSLENTPKHQSETIDLSQQLKQIIDTIKS